MSRKPHLLLSLAGLLACSLPCAAQTNLPARTDYAFFRIIPDRNLFNPNRYPLRRGASPNISMQSAPAESFTLVGTMSYEKGTFAFFAGSAPAYQKVLVCDGEIAGFRLTAIRPNGVQLTSSNSTFELPVGSQLLRDAEAGWTQPPNASSQTVVQAEVPTVPPTASGGDSAASDILKKLMQKREQEQ